jgi:RNA polymerase sigma factor (sigma-70 family)
MRMILKNVLRDKLEKHKRELDHFHVGEIIDESTAGLGGILIDSGTSPSEQAEKQEMLLKQAEAIERLPDDQRDVVICHYVLGLRVGETAQNLGRTEKSVAGLLYRAKKQLGDWLE